MEQARYRRLRRWKYQLVAPYGIETGIRGYAADTGYLKLSPGGRLVIAGSYAWDGPSGPTIDTGDFMRGSLVHDALYQLIRLRVLPPRYRYYADLLLLRICLEDGMRPFRAGYVFWAVRLFGWSCAAPGSEPPAEILTAPPAA